MNSPQATKPRTLRDPLSALRSPDKRIRQDVLKAVRYVAQHLGGEKLRSFSIDLAVLLTKWNSTPAPQEVADQ